jgi:hypothetical protein
MKVKKMKQWPFMQPAFAKFAHYSCQFGKVSLIFLEKDVWQIWQTHELAPGNFSKFGWFLS